MRLYLYEKRFVEWKKMGCLYMTKKINFLGLAGRRKELRTIFYRFYLYFQVCNEMVTYIRDHN